MEVVKDVFISVVVAEKLEKKDYEHLKSVNGVPPRFGRNWWFVTPMYRKTDLGWDIKFLCFGLSYDNYGNKVT